MTYNDLIESLIETNKQFRKHLQDESKYSVSPLFYALEFCTIAVDIGRGVGKTTFIKNHAKRGDLVVTYNFNTKRIHYGMHTEYDVIAPFELEKMKGKRYKNIYIDEPALVFEGDYEKKLDFYRFIIYDYDEQTFVLLGRQI